MELLVTSVLVLGAIVGFTIAWHWQRIKYEKVLKLWGKTIREEAKKAEASS
jgi:hypothetical protein